MIAKHPLLRLLVLPVAFLLVACHDQIVPTEPQAAETNVAAAPGHAAALANPVREAMGLPQTVFAGRDEATGQVVIGVENAGVARAVDRVMAAHGVSPSAYRVTIAEPIHMMNTSLQSAHRPTVGGIQIHFGNYVCTLGFNVAHAGGASFITNSHCTNNQGTTGSTLYYQPLSSAEPTSIAIEADDPSYQRIAGCSAGKVCRYSDAARAVYHNGTNSSVGKIAKTATVNNGSLAVSGHFTITDQNNSSTTFSSTVNKVGRTTGWSSGNVTNTCVTVNVSGTNIQLLCQTIVQRSGTKIVGGGDSGSPVFQTGSGDNVTLVGILWGGNTSGDLFVFSPLKNIQDELGSFNAVTADPPGGGGEDPPPPPPCRPRGNSGNCV